MKRVGSMVGMVAMTLLVSACTSFSAEVPETAKPATDPGAQPGTTPANPKENAPPPPAVTPPMSELTEKFGYFVTEHGRDDNDGSRAKPFATIGMAMSKAKVDGKRIYVCQGNYAEALTLEDGVSMIGGYDCSKSEWMNGSGKAKVNAPTSPAMRAKDIVTKTRFEGFEVVAPNVTEPSASSIGLIAENAGALVIVSTKIAAGNAAAGRVGTPAIQLVPSGSFDGLDGFYAAYTGVIGAQPAPPAPRVGVAGGTGVCSGAPGHDGGEGGRGNGGAIWFASPSGVGGSWVYMSGDLGGESKDGADGANGTDGASAQSTGTFGAQGYVTADGTAGGHGKAGNGGAGGAGNGPGFTPYPVRTQYWYGNGGGSGGAGGCPGLAGGPGRGGGASVGVLLWESPVTFEKSELESADGGSGGRGTFASSASSGGAGGKGVFCPADKAPCNYEGPAANGQPGGRGGDAGVSGAGAGGPSMVVVHHGAAPTLTATKTKVGRGGFGVAEMSNNGRVIPASADGEAKEVASY